MPLTTELDNSLFKGAFVTPSGSINYPSDPAGYTGPDPEVHNRQLWATNMGLGAGFNPTGLWGGKDNEASGKLPDWLQGLVTQYQGLTDPAAKDKLWRHIMLNEGVADKYKAAAGLHPMSAAIQATLAKLMGIEPGTPPDSTSGHGGV